MAGPRAWMSQAQLRAASDARQAQVDERADKLLAEHGDRFEHTAERLGVEDEHTRKLAAEHMAQSLAEKNASPERMDHQDYMRIADDAVGKAYKTEELERQTEGRAGPTGQLADPGTQMREPEPDPKQIGEPTSPAFEAGAERQIGTYADLTREHSEIVARLEAGEDLGAGEKKPSFFEDRAPEQAPPGNEIDPKQEQAATVQPSQAQDAGEPDRRKLHFYGELKQEQSQAQGRGAERSETREPGDGERKRLAFFEDRNPARDPGMEH